MATLLTAELAGRYRFCLQNSSSLKGKQNMFKLKIPRLLRSSSQHLRLYPFSTTPKESLEAYWYKPHNGLETGIVVYNPIARRKVPVILPNKHFISFYTCGPTVYDSSHIGHASSYVKLDIIQRLLRNHFNFNLVTAMNVTDVDDKIIQKSQDSGKDWREISRSYESEFWNDLSNLGVAEPNLKLRVSEHIPEIILFIKQIIKAGLGYVSKDGSVYFNVRKFPIYGKLQNINMETAANDELTAELDAGKHFAADFALWKAKKFAYEPSWDSPWGVGRPGWHIECSTLASLVFGGNIDFHAGGLDLRFPHHENEEAQCCAYHDTKQWTNYWLHTGQLSVRGQTEKMSKSLKNTISIGEMLTHYSSDEFRMACAISNYRNSVEYSQELMETARGTLNRFRSFRLDCAAYLSGKKPSVSLEASSILKNLNFAKSQLDTCYKDDFDTARAISVLLETASNLSRSINVNNTNHSNQSFIASSCLDSVAAIDNFVEHSLRCMGFSLPDSEAKLKSLSEDGINVNQLIDDILQSRRIIRERAITAKNNELYKICDEIRNCLNQHGIVIRDHSLGSSWTIEKTMK